MVEDFRSWREGKAVDGRKGTGKYRRRPDIPPRNRQDIRCINCGGVGHSWRACPNPEVPKEKRPCLKCGKPGHIAKDCTAKAALNVEGDTEAKPAYAMVCKSEAMIDEVKPRGRPFEKIYDEEGFEVVKGGFRPVPKQTVLRDSVGKINNWRKGRATYM